MNIGQPTFDTNVSAAAEQLECLRRIVASKVIIFPIVFILFFFFFNLLKKN